MATSLWADDLSIPTGDEARVDSVWSQLLAAAAGREPPNAWVDDAADSSFWNRYAPIALGRDRPAFVIGQLGQSLDGRIATATGRSHYINGPEAIRHLHRLRALVDAVVVGIGTVLADDPLLTVRQVNGPSPARVVIDPNGRLPPEARLLAADGSPILVLQTRDQPRPAGVMPVTIAPSDGRLDPVDIVEALAARGFRRLLIEGGAGTVSNFLSAGAINRLHVCVAPIMIGSGPVGITLPPIDHLDGAMRPRTAIHRLGRDILFDCELVRSRTGA